MVQAEVLDVREMVKPKKTILVKVGSNEMLPSRSDLATKHDEDYLNQGLSSLEKEKDQSSREQFNVNLGSQQVASSNETMVDDYGHFREETNRQSSKEITQGNEETEEPQPLTAAMEMKI